MTNRRLSLATTLALSVALAACIGTTDYELELRPDGPAMHRTLAMPVGKERFDHVSALYGAAPTPADLAAFEEQRIVGQIFTGVFENELPDDIGGAGYLLHYASPIGSTSLYTERFRGNIDFAGMLKSQEAAFQRLWDLLLVFCDQELSGAEGYAAFRRFVDTELRNDAWNILLLLSSTDTIGRTVLNGDRSFNDTFSTQLAVRIGHYLAARNYFDASRLQEEMPRLSDLRYWEAETLSLVARGIARSMGRPDQLPAALERLMQLTSAELEEAYDRLLVNPAAVELVASWNADLPFDAVSALEEGDLIGHLAEQSVGFEFIILWYAGPVLHASLYLPVEPYETNGLWDDAGVVSWDKQLSSIDPVDADLPVVTYAAWSEPDIDYQLSHFGAVLFEDELLRDDLLWRETLSEQRRAEWDELLEGLAPVPGSVGVLEEFSFSDEVLAELPSGRMQTSAAHEQTDLIKRLMLRGPKFCPEIYCSFDVTSGWQRVEMQQTEKQELLRESETLVTDVNESITVEGPMTAADLHRIRMADSVEWFANDSGSVLACLTPQEPLRGGWVHFIFEQRAERPTAPVKRSVYSVCNVARDEAADP